MRMENASCRTSHSIAGQCHTPIRLAATSKQLQLQLAFFRILTHAHCLSLRCRDVDREIKVHPRIVSHQFVDVHFAQCTCTLCTMHMHILHNAHFAQCTCTFCTMHILQNAHAQCTFCTMQIHMHMQLRLQILSCTQLHSQLLSCTFAQCKMQNVDFAQCKMLTVNFAQCSSKFSAAAYHTSIKLAGKYLQLQLAF